MNLSRENQMLINATRKWILSMRKIDDNDPEKEAPGTPTILSIVLVIPPKRSIQGNEIKILSPKEVLQRLPIVLAQIEARNISENLLNKIRQIIYSLCQAKKNFKASI